MTPPDYTASTVDAIFPAACQSPDGGYPLALASLFTHGDKLYFELELDPAWLIDASVGEIVIQSNVGIDPSAPTFSASSLCGQASMFGSGNTETSGPGTIDAVQLDLSPNDGPDEAVATIAGVATVDNPGTVPLALWALVQGDGDLATKAKFSATINVWKIA